MLGAYQDSRPAPGGKPKVNFGMKDDHEPPRFSHGAMVQNTGGLLVFLKICRP